jgi:hypothetical protein
MDWRVQGGLPPVCLRSIIAMDTTSSAVSRADQRNMSKTNSVAFIKVRKRVQALATQHADAIAALKAAGLATAPEVSPHSCCVIGRVLVRWLLLVLPLLWHAGVVASALAADQSSSPRVSAAAAP